MNCRCEAVLIANTKCGGARSFLRTVARLQEVGIRVDSTHFDLRRDSIASVVDDARNQGIELVLAFGGDGTVGSVVDAIVGRDVVLGIIAAGTSNNFARGLGIASEVKASIDVLMHGQETRIPIGQINGRYFAHAAIMGLNVEFARRSQILRRFVGRLSYPMASLLAYHSRQRFTVTVEDATGTRRLETYQLALLNAAASGGRRERERGLNESSETQLSVSTVHDLRLRTVIRGLPEIFFQRHLGLPGSERFAISAATISCDETMPITLDGEIWTQTPATVRVVPAALRVMAARGYFR